MISVVVVKQAFLLGAGASADAGIPLAREMTRHFTRDDSPVRDFELLPLLRYVVGGLLFQEAARGHDPHESADVEELFTVVKMLHERHESPLNPFVSSWAPLLEQLAEPRLPI